MTEAGVPYKKRPREPKKDVKIPPPPDIPSPTPEIPPHGPIPGEPPAGSQKQIYVCPICGMTFNSKEELQLHMANNHPRSTGQSK